MIDLHDVLVNLGITALRDTPKEIVGQCPLHEQRTGKPDIHPSWSMNRISFLHSCFSCGYKGTLNGLFLDLTGSIPDDLERTLAREGFLHRWAQARAAPEQALSSVVPILTEWALSHLLGDVPDRMLALRNLARAAVDTYEVRWEQDARRWVLPLRATDGALLGAQYRQKGSVLTLPEGLPKSATLFGFQQCCPYNYCALVESPLDAVRLFGLGIPACSSLGAWVSKEQVCLLARHFTRVYLALDNDKVGQAAAEQVAPALRKAGTVPLKWDYRGLTDVEGSPAKDPGDVADDEQLLESWGRTQRMGL